MENLARIIQVSRRLCDYDNGTLRSSLSSDEQTSLTKELVDAYQSIDVPEIKIITEGFGVHDFKIKYELIKVLPNESGALIWYLGYERPIYYNMSKTLSRIAELKELNDKQLAQITETANGLVLLAKLYKT